MPNIRRTRRRVEYLTPEQNDRINARRRIQNMTNEQREINNERARIARAHSARVRIASGMNEQRQGRNDGRCVQISNRRNVFYKCALINNPNYVLPDQNNLGAMDKECTTDHCRALHYTLEKGKILHSCCHNGKISPQALSAYPQGLRALLTEDCSQSKNFRNFIRQYNSANAFASFGAQIVNIPGNGPYCLKISGEVYHLTSRSMRVEGETPSYAQLYVYDSDEAIRVRMSHPSNADCYQNIMATIDSEIRRVSPYAHQYKKLKEAVEEEELRIAANGGSGQVRDIRLLFTRSAADDQRRYNAPTGSNEIAMVYVADRDGNLPTGIDIAVYPKDVQGLQRVATLSKHLDPMVFPLLFPSGEFGWTPGFQHHADFSTAQRHNVTAMQFYASKLAVRRNIFNPVHYAGKLFQQYLIHAYIIYESGRLDYIRKNQRHLRVECYQGLQDHVRNLATDGGVRVGNIVILPSSYTGGPRHMNKLYHDSMAMVRKFGRPDLFITFTCNPKWPEIQNELETYQTATDRPDIVARVFQLKVKEFIHDMTEKHVFGKVICWVYTIEQQKRGLPHLHGVFTLCNQDKLYSTSDIDNAVSAELPDPRNSVLYHIILKNNIHGPCGVLNPRSVCMTEGKCSKKFPKSFKDATENNSASYPEYRRRDNFSENHFVRGVRIDNRFVVPYNAFLSKKYDAHINVEICSSVASIKYIHKYISKGFDCARMEIRQEAENLEENVVIQYDEIKQYINCRYVSAPEAAWRILENPLHDQSHSILLLALHLPDSQSVYFVEGREEEALRQASTKNTSLTAWFQLNNQHVEGRSFLYQDVPNNYVFSADKKWTKRQRGGNKVIGRIPSISPRNIELYHLRLILLKVPGATSFECLRTVDGNLLATFRDAARQLKLIDDIGEWKQCMTEASSYLMPKPLRHLFVLILIQCIPSDPLELWNDFNKCMSEDFFHHDVAEETAINLCLLNIQDMLIKENSSCRMQGLPEPRESCSFGQVTDFNVMSENTLGELMAAKLNDEQRQAYDSILNKFFSGENDDNKCFFIDGPGGTGKTFLYETLIHTLRGKGKKVLSVAWTGIAALLLPGGVTCHSAFNLPLNLQDNTTCKVTSKNRKIITEADIIIWDEAPMAPGIALEVIERTVRDIMGNDLVFGNKVVVLGGDFRQTLPVCRRASRGQLIAACIKSSILWQHFKTFQLKTNVRALESEKLFSKWLLDLGDGKLPPVEGTSESSVLIPNVNICQNIIQCIYGERHTDADALLMSHRTILCPKNDNVRAINEDVLQRLEGPMKTFHSVDTIINEEGDLDVNEQVNFPVEFLNSISPNGLPPHILNLKIGAIIMLLRNLSIGDGLSNGTRMIVKNFSSNLIQAEIITGNRKGTVHFIPRISLNTLSDVTIPFNMCRKQFPVKLAYAMTINKSQGQTFERVGLLLPEPVFSHGQLYVACSRVRAQSSLFIQIVDGSKQGQILTGWYTENIVYKEIFS